MSEQAASVTVSGGPSRGWGRAAAQKLSPRNISAIYVFLAMFVIFSIWIPGTFLTGTTFKTLLDNNALNAIVAIALVVPLAAGAFDLAVGANVGVTSVLVAWLLVNQGSSVPVAIVLALVAGVVVGLTSGLLVTWVKIDSFIATLGVSSILVAITKWITGGSQILGLSNGFQQIANGQLFGITYPVYYMVVIAAVVWYGLEATPAGRRVYSTGGNIDAARLAGIRTSLVIVAAFMVGGLIAGAAGVLESSNLATGDPTVGPGFLIPAFTAAFLGSTQFRNGRFNVWGTVVAVYVLATGVKGLQLAGAPVWIPDLFNGVALLAAVGLAVSRSGRRIRVRGLLPRRRAKVLAQS